MSPLAQDEARLNDVLAGLCARFAATAAQHDQDASFPHENFALLRQSGLIPQAIPRAYAGPGIGLAAARRIVSAIGSADPSTALVLAMTYAHHRQIANAAAWPDALKRQVFASAIEEGALINALRVEPDLGTPARGGLPDTVATRAGDRWLLRGRKIYSTGSPALRWLLVWARTNEPEPRVGAFLVPHHPGRTAGIRIVENWNHLGLRASGSHEVVFEDAAVPLENAPDLRPAKAPAVADAESQLWIHLLISSLYDGVARAGFDWVKEFVRTRVPGSLGAALATLPKVQETVGEIATLLRTSQILLDHAVAGVDAGTLPTQAEAGMVKFTVTNNAVRSLELALQLSGNHGLSRNNPLERHYRDVLCSRVHTPQNDSILTAAGRIALA